MYKYHKDKVKIQTLATTTKETTSITYKNPVINKHNTFLWGLIKWELPVVEEVALRVQENPQIFMQKGLNLQLILEEKAVKMVLEYVLDGTRSLEAMKMLKASVFLFHFFNDQDCNK